MASRRDELNAFTFARKRTVGAFLQPGGGGSDEDAPRPVRAVLPSVVVAAVIVAGFGMWGIFKPSAPVGWNNGKNIIQGTKSTTRYVVLPDDKGNEVLHQVLNMSSARLLLPVGSSVVSVDDSVLDAYQYHGATVGIQYAPDRLPDETDAAAAKKWSVCDRPGAVSSAPNEAVFIAADKEAAHLADHNLVLSGGQALFVQTPPDTDGATGSTYLVDAKGVEHSVGDLQTKDITRRALVTALFGGNAQPEQVTKDWLDTLDTGNRIDFPAIPDFQPGKKIPSSVQLSNQDERFVGRLVKYQQSNFFVVGKSDLYPISPFQAQLLAGDPDLNDLYSDNGGTPKFADLSPNDFATLVHSDLANSPMRPSDNWPVGAPGQAAANDAGKGRTVVCSTFDGMDGQTVKRSVWADSTYPAPISGSSATAHVTPGHGLFYRAFDSSPNGSGNDFLITETGLRYSVPSSSDSAQSGASPAPAQSGSGDPGGDNPQARLGYKDIQQPALVPSQWSNLVQPGPVLSTSAAGQAQNA